MDPRRQNRFTLAVDNPLFTEPFCPPPPVKSKLSFHAAKHKLTPLESDVEMLDMSAALALEMPDDPLPESDSDDALSIAGSEVTTATAPSIASPTPSTASTASASHCRTQKAPVYPPEVLAHMPLPPRAEHVDQRERNRLIVKRCYYKKISTLNELRAELGRVETTYQSLLRQKQAESVRPTSATELARQKTQADTLHAAYVELALLLDALRREHEELRRVETEYTKMEKQMAQLKLAQQKTIDQQREAQEQKRRNPIVELAPLSPADCHAIALEMSAKIMAFRASKNIFTTGASIFGWRDRHRVQNNKLEFLLEKGFTAPSMDDLADQVWQLLSHPVTLAQMYSPHMDVLYHEVQRVDDNNVVFYHTLERRDSDDRIKALVLATRLYLGPERGWLIGFRGLDPKRYLIREGKLPRPRDRRGRNKIEPQKEDIWIDVFVWGLFYRAPDGVGCVNDFGGLVDGTSLISASWWMIEKLQFALRIEKTVVGPPFVLSM